MPLSWSYGVTTVPSRLRTTLPRTLQSLARGGFPTPRLFVDGGLPLDAWHDFDLPLTLRLGDPARTVGNWVCTLWELWVRNPEADYYAIFQDDFVTVRNLREYLERDGGLPTPGYRNLYTFPGQAPPGESSPGWHESKPLNHNTHMQSGRGAVALVFDRAAVVALLSARTLVEKPLHPTKGWKAVDGAIVTALNIAGFREYVHKPSLTQHIGEVSSMGNRPHPSALDFPGTGFDALTLIPTASPLSPGEKV